MKITVKERENLHDYTCDEIPEILQKVLQKRNILSAVEFDHSLKHLKRPDQLSNIDKASDRIIEAIMANESIVIVGDYDVDGATSVVLMVKALKALGAKNINFIVPHRIYDGYGLTEALLIKTQQFNPSLIITVDNGISSFSAVQKANELEIDVIITDHHLASEKVPNAYAIVNPNLPESSFEDKALCGVGVAFYVLSAVRTKMVKENLIAKEINFAKYLDLVAIGTISDIVSFSHNNRCLVHQGLLRIRKRQTLLGIVALCELSGRNLENLTTTDIAFCVAPLLNAAGRIDDMTLAVECLLTDNEAEAYQLAEKLLGLDQQRKMIEKTMLESAKLMIFNDKSQNNAPIVLADETWSLGITGIVAAKIKDEFNQPTIIFAKDGEFLKASARSTDNLHLKELLDSIAVKYPDLLRSYGGHSQAAGLSILAHDFERFKTLVQQEVALMNLPALEKVIATDGSLVKKLFTVENAKILSQTLPWGKDFEEPLFHNQFDVIEAKILKNLHVKFTLKYKDEELYLDGIAFFQADKWQQSWQSIEAVYKLSVNEWNGQENLQLMIEYFNEI